jgi:hypothetical protein
MSHIELDDGILDHPKFIRAVATAGSDVVFLWLGLRSYCSKYLTDGFVPRDMIDEVRGPKNVRSRKVALDTLISVNLVELDDQGIRLHDYLDHSSSREQVETWRRKARERKAASRSKSRSDTPCDDHSDSHSDPHGSLGVGSLRVTDTRVRGEGEEGDKGDSGSESLPKKTRGKTKAPESIEPNEATLAAASETGRSWAKDWIACRDWAWGKNELRSDWQATLRGWMRRAAESGGKNGQHREPPQPNNLENPYKLNII